MKLKVNCGKFSPEFNSVGIGGHKQKSALKHAKSTLKSEFDPYAVFLIRAQPSENFALSSINRDQPKELFKSENDRHH